MPFQIHSFIHSFLEVLGGVIVFHELHRRLCQLCGWEDGGTSKFSWQYATCYCLFEWLV